MAITDANGSDISVLLGIGTGAFSTVYSFAVDNEPTSIISADFNGDGKFDVATSNDSPCNVSVLLNCNSSLGVEKFIYEKEQIIVYPNPSNGYFVLETNNLDEKNLKIFDSNGQIVLRKNINGIINNINMTDLDEGIYNRNISDYHSTINKKLIIVH